MAAGCFEVVHVDGIEERQVGIGRTYKIAMSMAKNRAADRGEGELTVWSDTVLVGSLE